MAAALAKLRDLLGPTSVPVEVGAADASALEQLVEDAFAELSGMVPSYSGPNATDLAALALELAEIRVVLAGERTARRINGVLQVQRALAHLRATGSTDVAAGHGPRIETCGIG